MVKNSGCKSTFGFTLIEVMIVLAMLGIITAIAIPSYQSFVLKSKRSFAKTALQSISAKQASYRPDNKTYGSLAELGYGSGQIYIDVNANISSSATGSVYVISMVNAVNTFTITATPNGSQTKDKECTSFTLNHLSEKGSTGTLSNCW